jgi:protein-tyrosine phosphatase
MFSTCPNFRELGGFLTEDGSRVRRGRLFRAGTLAHLAPADHAVISGFGIKTVCDLRHASEAAQAPTDWPGVSILAWDYAPIIAQTMAPLATESTPEMAEACMMAFYAGLPAALQEPILGLLKAIAHGGTPLLFHCSAGKDRTGVVAGLLLDVLGVARDDVMADYARSAELMDYEAMLRKDPDRGLGLARDGFSISRLARPVRARLLASDPRYLSAMFEKIEGVSGSVEAYLVDELGVPAEHIARVRAELLD